MREMTFDHNGETYTLAATFAASIEIADKVDDPLMIAREAALEAAMMQARMPYRPKFDFTTRNVPQIIHIGLKAAGSKATLAEVQEIVFDKGLVHSRLIAADYIALIVEPKPRKPEVEPEDEISDQEAAGNAQASKAGAVA
jgi:hypothetical protein